MARSGLRTRSLVAHTILLLALAALWPSAGTAQPFITEFPLPAANSFPFGIVAGPDGNLWFTDVNHNKIGRITPGGVLTEFPLPTPDAGPLAITAGPDGNLWFTENRKIGRITPAGVVTEFAIPSGSVPEAITAGPDGNLWFTEHVADPPLSGPGSIGRITPAGVITEFTLPAASTNPLGITGGPDGNVWFIEGSIDKVGRITPAGVITEFPLPAGAVGAGDIVAGPDGNLWFGLVFSSLIGRITPAGVFTFFDAPGLGPGAITAGPDGNLWTTGIGSQIGRITPAGVVTRFQLPTSDAVPLNITAGPDGNIWFTEADGNKVGRLRPPPVVTISPGSGGYATTQRFDLVVTVVTGGPQVAGGQVLFDGADVTLNFFDCAIFGTLAAGGQTARCPGLSGSTFSPGGHTLSISVSLSNGSVIHDSVNWQIDPNQEP